MCRFLLVGLFARYKSTEESKLTSTICSHRPTCYDVPYPVQGQVRNTSPSLQGEKALGPDWVLNRDELDRGTLPYG